MQITPRCEKTGFIYITNQYVIQTYICYISNVACCSALFKMDFALRTLICYIAYVAQITTGSALRT